MKYTVIAAPPIAQPIQGGVPATALDDRSHRPELAREDEQRSHPQDAGRRTPEPRRCNDARGSRRPCEAGAAAASRRIAGPIQSARTTDPIAAEPTHHHAAMPCVYPRRRGADGRSGADVRGEHGRKQQARAETPARDEEVAGAAHTAANPQTERHQRQRVAEEDDEVEVHFRSRTAGIAGDAGGLARGAHDGVGHDFGGERADLPGVGVAGASPVASVKMTSPSPGVCDGASARAKPSCAICDTRVASVFVRRAFVATTPSVVFCRRRRRSGAAGAQDLAARRRTPCHLPCGRRPPPGRSPDRSRRRPR